MKTPYLVFFLRCSIVFLVAVSSAKAIRIGELEEFLILPSIEYTSDSNIFANSLESDDNLIEANLEALYRNESGIVATELLAGVKVKRFDDFDIVDSEDFRAFASIFYPNRVSDAISYEAEASYTETTAPVAEEGAILETNYIAFGGEFYVPYSDKFGFTISGNYETREVKTDGFEDQNLLSIAVEWDYEYNPRLDFYGSYRYRPSEVDRTGLESTDHAVYVGARGELSGKVTGEFAAGVQRRSFKDDLLDEETAPFYSLELTWALSQRTSIEIVGASDFGVTGSGRSTDNKSIGLSLVQIFNDALSFSAGIDYLDSALTSLDADEREDEQIAFNARATYSFAEQRGNVYLEGSLADRSSDSAFFEYKRNIISLGVDYTF